MLRDSWDSLYSQHVGIYGADDLRTTKSASCRCLQTSRSRDGSGGTSSFSARSASHALLLPHRMFSSSQEQQQTMSFFFSFLFDDRARGPSHCNCRRLQRGYKDNESERKEGEDPSVLSSPPCSPTVWSPRACRMVRILMKFPSLRLVRRQRSICAATVRHAAGRPDQRVNGERRAEEERKTVQRTRKNIGQREGRKGEEEVGCIQIRGPLVADVL